MPRSSSSSSRATASCWRTCSKACSTSPRSAGFSARRGRIAEGATPESALILCAPTTILRRTWMRKEPYGEGRDARISGGGHGAAPQCDVQGEARERTRDHRPYGGANGEETPQGA